MHDPVHQALRRAARPTAQMLLRLALGTSRSIRLMLDQISKNFFQPRYSVTNLRRDLRLDYRYIRWFRAAVGLTPKHLIRECRMETAMRLLRDTLLTVEEITILVGYDSERSLERLCRRWCGLTPAELRKHLRRVAGHLEPGLEQIPEEAFSWYFWQQYRCNALTDDELLPVIEYLEQLKKSAG